ncbi:fungal-specific transcription factor domain-containing protein [Pyronema omphalodes]|nr:fungal-specific transcription factor domain-containing protein [Pyronema omphalodes]
MSISATASPHQYAPTHHRGGQLGGQLAAIQQQYHQNHYHHTHIPNLHLNQSYSPHLQQPPPQHAQPLPPHPQLFNIHPQQARPSITIPPLPPAPTGGPAPTSNADCYTCRRRRVKCDRQLPCCAKCNRTKLECLGYKKPLVWNKGVASRGKMMGKTFPAPAENNSTNTTAEIAAKKEREKGQQRSLINQSPAQTAVMGNMSPMNQITPLTPVSINSPRSPFMHAEDIEDETTATATGGALISTTKRNVGAARYNNMKLLPGELTLSLKIPSPNIFRNLDSQGRYYMDYFEKRVASDLVLFDRVTDNPYRHLLPVAANHPALLNGMLAVAARHHANACGSSLTIHMPYKSHSINSLAHDLANFGRKGQLSEATLAVVMLFIFFETLDGGLDTWKIHLRGARWLIGECLKMPSLPDSTAAMLQIFMNHVTLVDIIGRTLAFADTNEPVVFDPEIPEFLDVLRNGEAYNFLGCPAELLELIHCVTLLKCRSPSSPLLSKKDDPDTYLSSCQNLLHRIDTFEPASYISTRDDIPDAPPGLLDLIAAYKFATRIYAMETLFPSVTTVEELAPYHEELRKHLGAIDDESMFLKGAVWLVFIAGTGARKEEEKEWTREQFKRLLIMLPQKNIRNAGEVLEGIWKRSAGTNETGWRWLERDGQDWLFV